MSGGEFNPDLPVVVRREFKGSNDKGKLVTFQPGQSVDWRKMGWSEDRVGSMVRSRYLGHDGAPISRVARKQASRLAEASRKGHSPKAAGKAGRKPKAAKPKAEAAPEVTVESLTDEERAAILEMRRRK